MGLDLIQVENNGAPDQQVFIVDPDTGERLALEEAKPEQLAAVAGRVKLALDDNAALLRDALRILGDEIIGRMDAGAEWTIRARGVKVSAPSPEARTHTWDAEQLRAILDDLVKAKVISRDAALRACAQRIENVPVAAGIAKLLKVPKAREAILMARREVEPPRRTASVKINAGEI